MGKYYAVVVGVVPGVYDKWAGGAEPMVKGFSGAVFKSFGSRKEAEEFMVNAQKITTDVWYEKPIPGKTIVYTDGSFAEGKCGYGVVIIRDNGEIYQAYGKPPLPPTNNVGELYAIYVALSLVSGDVIVHSDSNYSIMAMTSYINSWIATGWQGVANKELIEAIYKKMNETSQSTGQKRNIEFIKVKAHSGIKYNELADRLSDQGRLSQEHMVVTRVV